MGPSLILMDPAYAVERMASSRRGLEAYIKKKSLEPLETYVPVVLAARCVDKPRLTVGVWYTTHHCMLVSHREQLIQAGVIMEADQKSARDLLRNGAFSGEMISFAWRLGMPSHEHIMPSFMYYCLI